MKILYGSDFHLRASTPSCRLDKDFYSVQLKKLQQIVAWLDEYKIDYCINGGDFYDSHEPTLRLINDSMSILKQSKIPWFVNVGNHDHAFVSMTTLNRCGLGVLAQADLVKTFEKVATVEFEVFEDTKAMVRFIPYTLDPIGTEYWFEEKKPDYKYIIVSHSMIVTHFVPYLHTLYQDVKTNADLLLCGHWHKNFDLVGPTGTRFVNPGPLSRQTVNEAKHTPCVAYIEIGKDIDVKFWAIPCQPASEVIDETRTVIPEREGLAEQFLATLKSSALESLDRAALLRTVGQQKGFDAKVVEHGLGRLKEIEKTVGVV